ncbi:ABC transporter substrate-binding protein [Lacticaseibacillus paracasei]|uniref:ABC transporter substrate-binding protein n=1 Tax=Lacticaseibacillus paracasei TaxID=1597 RepID=UPI00403F7BFE
MKKQTKTIGTAVAIIAALAIVLLFAFVNQNKKTTSTTNPSPVADVKKDDNYVLKLGDPGGVCGAPQQIAQVKGFFKKVGLKYKVVKVDANTTGIEAVTSGKVDASNSLLGSIVQPIANGAQLKITTGLHTGCISVLTAKGSTLKVPKDFVGKKIGVAAVAGSEATFTKRWLGDHGIKVGTNNAQVQFVQYDASELPIALEKGQVDAIAIEDPTVQIAVKQYGFNIVSSSAETKPFNTEYCCVAYVSAKIAKEHPEAARKYTLAMQEATDWVKHHQSQTANIQISNKFAAGKASVNEKALQTYDWKASYYGGQKAFIHVGKDLQKIGIVNKSTNLNTLAKSAFLKVQGVQ